MRLWRAILAIISWTVLLGLVAFVVLQTGEDSKMARLRSNFEGGSDTFFANLSDVVSPLRTHPLTTVELEENLKVILPLPFKKFNQNDWEWFWNLLYGRFPQDSGGCMRRERQLSRQEIQETLSIHYYQPFSSFKEQQWKLFWQHGLKGKVFK
ncbi:MAG: hypothetical protein NG712_05875 [Omnitrophica bacterium]|nr:hypothetical protein [Candidatus Omnitrophota bacterium]